MSVHAPFKSLNRQCSLQAQLDNADLKASADRWQQESEEATQANAKLQAQHHAQQQAWQEQKAQLIADRYAQVRLHSHWLSICCTPPPQSHLVPGLGKTPGRFTATMCGACFFAWVSVESAYKVDTTQVMQ